MQKWKAVVWTTQETPRFNQREFGKIKGKN